ncbi:MAG TPA: hypothetical protein VEJ89_02105 [Myxococcaceae bacterium]|nr:hypothetical protein [Myxococcaceae bacterium]
MSTAFPIHDRWVDVLAGLLAEARRLAPEAVFAFDLDSTLLDNRPRQAAIVRAYGRERGLPALSGFEARHLHTGFDLRDALQRHGLGADEVERLLVDFRPYWRERFFTSEACRVDIPVRGAPGYVRRAREAGAQVVYVTARPEPMRPGTLEVMERHGFPLPGEGVELAMKGDPDVTDDEFKRGAHRRLAARGRVTAAFDNEPGHINDYRASFPGATAVLVATGHSGRVTALAEGVIAVPHLDIGHPRGRSRGTLTPARRSR